MYEKMKRENKTPNFDWDVSALNVCLKNVSSEKVIF